MSTILDSLKKSSDQRDNNSQTSIDSFNFGEKKSTPLKGFLILIIIAAIVATIMYVVYDKYFKDDITTQSEPIEKTANATVPPEITKTSLDNTKLAQVKKPVTKDQTKKIQKPDINKVRQELQNKKKELETNNTPKKNKPSQKIADLNQHTRTTKNVEKPNKTYTTPDKVEKKPEIKLKTPSERQAEQAKVVQQKYPYVYQLPFSVRKEIPKFTLNVHIFDENPENRVVVINGAKFIINDLIEEEVLIKDIVTEGVVLEFNETEFLVPKL